MPSRVKPASHTHLARFASKPVPRAYVPKRARSRAAGKAEPVTSQDSLAAEVLLSLCPSGYRQFGADVGDGAVESAAPLPAGNDMEQKQVENVEPVSQPEQVMLKACTDNDTVIGGCTCCSSVRISSHLEVSKRSVDAWRTECITSVLWLVHCLHVVLMY